MEEDFLEKCHFYKLEESNVDVCVYVGDKWENTFVAINSNSGVFMLHGESNMHQGEKANRKVIANFVTNDLIPTIPLKKISPIEISPTFRESIKDYLKLKI